LEAITALIKFVLASDAENITAVSFTRGVFVVLISTDGNVLEHTYTFEELIMATVDSQNNPCDPNQNVTAHLSNLDAATNLIIDACREYDMIRELQRI
jgi:hypothetical protein